jgi:hypothetical protein
MTQDKALKLALEALGEIEWSNNSQWQSDRAKEAITATKEALAQPVQRPWVGLTDDEKIFFSTWLDYKEDHEVFTAIEAKLKELNT